MTITLHYHRELDTVPDKTFFDGQSQVELPRFYPPAVEACDEGRYVGHVEWVEGGEIEMIAVDPAYRRRGVARRLLWEAIQHEPRLHNSGSMTPDGAALANSVQPAVSRHIANQPPEDEQSFVWEGAVV